MLISLIFSEKLFVYQFKPQDTEIKVSNHSALICFILKGRTIDDKFYVLATSTEKEEKLNKKIYYNLSDVPCNITYKDINISDAPNIFQYHFDKPNLGIDDNGFTFEYQFEKKNQEENYLLMFYTNFTGNKMTIKFSDQSIVNTIILFIIIVVIFIVIMIILTIIVYKCVIRKRTDQFNQKCENSIEAPLDT